MIQKFEGDLVAFLDGSYYIIGILLVFHAMQLGSEMCFISFNWNRLNVLGWISFINHDNHFFTLANPTCPKPGVSLAWKTLLSSTCIKSLHSEMYLLSLNYDGWPSLSRMMYCSNIYWSGSLSTHLKAETKTFVNKASSYFFVFTLQPCSSGHAEPVSTSQRTLKWKWFTHG